MDLDVYSRFLLALLFILALIGVLAWAARRFGVMGRLAPTVGGARRLSVVEVLPLDGRHKLVLMRCDRSEHLVLLGPGDSLLVARGHHEAQAGPAPGTSEEAAP